MKLLKTLAFTLSIFLISCSSSTNNSNNKKTITRIDAVDLSKDILENQIAAEIKYLEKELIITNCVVIEIGRGANMAHMYWPSDDDNTIYITISVGDKYNVNNHTFWLKKDQHQIASELKKSQIIRVRGLVKHVWAREFLNCGQVNMDDCTILQNEDGSYIWEYDSQETAYGKMKEEQKQAQLKEQLEREKAEMKMLEMKAEEERQLSDDKDEVAKTINTEAEENESEDADELRLQEEIVTSIRENFYGLKDIWDDLIVTKINDQITIYSTLIYPSENNHFCGIIKSNGVTNEFYVKNDKLYFVYNFGNGIENRYYFNNNVEIVRWLDSNKGNILEKRNEEQKRLMDIFNQIY